MALSIHTRHAKPSSDSVSPSGKAADASSPGKKARYRVPEAMRLLSLSRSVICKQIRIGRLRSVKEGTTRLIPADAIEEYVALPESESRGDR